MRHIEHVNVEVKGLRKSIACKIAMAAAIALAGAASALASAGYRAGSYVGRTREQHPRAIGTIAFTVASGHLSMLVAKGTWTCGDSAGPGYKQAYRFKLPAKDRVGISKAGKFRFRGGPGHAELIFNGTLTGGTAKGTFVAEEVEQDTFQCEADTSFAASVKR